MLRADNARYSSTNRVYAEEGNRFETCFTFYIKNMKSEVKMREYGYETAMPNHILT